jgi:hypothetical protein
MQKSNNYPSKQKLFANTFANFECLLDWCVYGGMGRRGEGEGGWNSKWKRQMAFRWGIGKVEKVD